MHPILAVMLLLFFLKYFMIKGGKPLLMERKYPILESIIFYEVSVIPSGDNEIEFKFDLPIYNQASLISTISSSIIILLFLLFILFKILDKEFPVV